MNMTHYNPWNIFDQLQHEINRAQSYRNASEKNTDTHASDWAPAVDIKEEKNKYVLLVDLPGVNPEEIDIHMEKGALSIKGERKTELKTGEEGFKRIERKHGAFERRFTLPEDVNPDAIDAKSNNGVLTVSIAKQEVLQPRKITIN